MGANTSAQRVGKKISYWLRHAPKQAGLKPDEDGWVSLSGLISELRRSGTPLDAAGIAKLNESADKLRWEIDVAGDRIRATHGHSYSVDPGVPASPPPTLYHGTGVKSLPSILSRGLAPRGREFVHLSTSVATAYAVGSRHGRAVIVTVATEGLSQPFYRTSDEVWLTRAIGPEHLSCAPWHPATGSGSDSGLEAELRREAGGRAVFGGTPAEDLRLIWRRFDRDDALFADPAGGCHLVHLTWTGHAEQPGFPAGESYAGLADWFATGLVTDQREYFKQSK
jgi:putative RNA 2'-phosphotransferase